MTNPASPVWLITGYSTGFGCELAKLILGRGWRAVVTARRADKVADVVADAGDHAVAAALDVNDHARAAARTHRQRHVGCWIDRLSRSGYYAASKHAVEGWSDSLLAEVEPLGIYVTCVEPGPFRTDWAGRSLRQTPSRLAEYAATAGQRT